MWAKLVKIFKQYGVITGIYLAFKRLYKRNAFNKMCRKISKFNIDDFKIPKNGVFKSYYSGSVDNDCSKILNGEKQILFYDKNDKNIKFDIKYRWELNRMQHLPVFASGIHFSNAEKYFLEEFTRNNLDKIFENTNAMEVAISFINILNALQLYHNNFDVPVYLKKAIIYILQNCEIGMKYSANHYFFNLIGLLWILENIKGSKKSKKIKDKIEKYLEKLLIQFTIKDGALYECSTYYHKYVTESLLYFLVFNKRFTKNKNIIKYAKKMYKFCCYASINDNIIGIGDNDSGRILPLPQYFYDKNDTIIHMHPLAYELGIEKYSEKDERNISNINLFSDYSFGLIKLNIEKWSVAVRCEQNWNNSVKKFIGCHSHNDQSSIIIYFDSIPFLVDSGTYLYIPNNSIRMDNLKMSSHNVAVINNKEINPLSNSWDYTERKTIGKIIEKKENKITFTHNGYDDEMQYMREIEINGWICITDKFYNVNKNDSNIDIYFHLSPNISIKQINENIVHLQYMNILFVFECTSALKIIDSSYSPEYGMKIDNKVIVASQKSINDVEISTKIYYENKV